MKYKLLLLDIDGTLTKSKQHALPSEVVCNAVSNAQTKLHVAVATGRPFSFAEPVVAVLRLRGVSLFNGGAEIVDTVSKEVLKRTQLEVETLQELVRLALPFGYEVFTDSDQYTKSLTSSDQIREPAAKLFIHAVRNADALHLLAQLNGVPGAEAHPTTSWEDGDVVDIHITHEFATKRHGAEELIAMLGVKKEEVIAVGDGYNDVPLLEAAGLKVAMGNAPEEVKQVADYVAPSLADDGVAEVINRFVLNG